MIILPFGENPLFALEMNIFKRWLSCTAFDCIVSCCYNDLCNDGTSTSHSSFVEISNKNKLPTQALPNFPGQFLLSIIAESIFNNRWQVEQHWGREHPANLDFVLYLFNKCVYSHQQWFSTPEIGFHFGSTALPEIKTTLPKIKSALPEIKTDRPVEIETILTIPVLISGRAVSTFSWSKNIKIAASASTTAVIKIIEHR